MSSQFIVPAAAQKKYLQRRLIDLEKINIEVSFGKFDLAKKIGHQIKGSAATFDFPALAEFGNRLEFAAEAEDMLVILNESRIMRDRIRKILNDLM